MNEYSSGAVKKRAYELIRGTKPSPVIASVVLFIISSLVGVLSFLLQGYGEIYSELMAMIYAGRIPDMESLQALYAYHMPPVGGSLLSLALSICLTVVATGFSWYCLRVARGEAPDFKAVFDGFGRFFKIIWLNIVVGFFVFLWSLLLIIPGIIAGIRYSQAVYVMYDHPDWGALKCINESKRMMRGNKGRYFWLGLSFIGWYILGGIVSAVLPYGIPVLDIWIGIYTGLAFALFYTRLPREGLPEDNPMDTPMF